MDFETLDDLLRSQSGAELHGVVTGWLSAGSSWGKTEAAGILEHWFQEAAVPVDLQGHLEKLGQEAAASLQDSELGFQLLLPADSTDINFRRQALSDWCGGFLSGFGMSGRFSQQELSEDVAEVLADLSRISNLQEDMEPSEENEADLLEIQEYVRMTALMVFTECAAKSPQKIH